jgi:hypothetical protein
VGAIGLLAVCAMASAGGRGGSSASSAPATGPALATRSRRTARRPTTTATPQAIARTRAALNAARAGDPIQKAAVNAAVAQALKDRGFLQLDGRPASAAQQQALRTTGQAIPEFDFPTQPGAPMPVPPPGGAVNDNAVPPAAATPDAAFQRTPKQAAEALQAFLQRTKRFGSGSDRPQEVKDAQRDMGIKADGIVGPITRKTAQLWSVSLPSNPRAMLASKAAKGGKKKA